MDPGFATGIPQLQYTAGSDMQRTQPGGLIWATTMIDKQEPDDLRHKRAQAVKTALILGIIATAIFATFIGSAIIGR